SHQTLTVHWNGTQWTLVSSPSPGSTATLYGVSVVAADDVWAVGNYTDTNGNYVALLERWDGFQWSVYQGASTTYARVYLQAVSIASANDVWAVGYFQRTSSSNEQTLVEHWDGTQWTVVSSP